MIEAQFRYPARGAARFTVSGHAGYADAGADVVCAAVSSAAYMAANTVTEILGVNGTADVKDGYLQFEFSGSEEAARIVQGLQLHLTELAAQYPGFIQIKTEV
jgi:uncharacterized protein YsxB (DUF464 family)